MQHIHPEGTALYSRCQHAMSAHEHARRQAFLLPRVCVRIEL